MIVKMIVSAVCYLVLAPLIGALLTGFGRSFNARLQGRRGASALQPFRDVGKLLEKKPLDGKHYYDYYVKVFFVFLLASGTYFFAGGDMLLVILMLAAADVFLILAAYVSDSTDARIGAGYELMRMMSYLPMFTFMSVGFYIYCGSLDIRDILLGTSMPALPLIGILAGYLFIFVIKSRKSPFDLSFSSDIVGRRLRGVTAEFSGKTLALVEIAHWYEVVLMLGFLFLFFSNGTVWGHLVGAAAAILFYFIGIFIKNCFASMKWSFMIKTAWIATLVLGAINIFMLYVMI